MLSLRHKGATADIWGSANRDVMNASRDMGER